MFSKFLTLPTDGMYLHNVANLLSHVQSMRYIPHRPIAFAAESEVARDEVSAGCHISNAILATCGFQFNSIVWDPLYFQWIATINNIAAGQASAEVHRYMYGCCSVAVTLLLSVHHQFRIRLILQRMLKLSGSHVASQSL